MLVPTELEATAAAAAVSLLDDKAAAAVRSIDGAALPLLIVVAATAVDVPVMPGDVGGVESAERFCPRRKHNVDPHVILLKFLLLNILRMFLFQSVIYLVKRNIYVNVTKLLTVLLLSMRGYTHLIVMRMVMNEQIY